MIKNRHNKSIQGVLIAWAFFLTAQAGAYELTPSIALDTQGSAELVAVGDVSGDGLADVVVYNNGLQTGPLANHVLLFRQQSDGTLAAAESFFFSGAGPQGAGTRGLELLDLDGDGALEIIAGNSNSLVVARAQAGGGFSFDFYSSPAPIHGFAVADVNLDGHDDLIAVKNTSPAAAHVHLNDGLGGLSGGVALDLSAGGSAFSVLQGDVNGDGWTDAVLVNGGGLSTVPLPDVTVFAFHGGADSGQPQYFSDGDASLSSNPAAAIADLDGDGLSDLLLLHRDAAGSSLQWLRQNSQGQLESPVIDQPIANGAFSRALRSADVDGDGLDDAVLVLQAVQAGEEGTLSVHINTGGALDAPLSVSLPVHSNTQQDSLALGDINGDGCIDALLAHPQNGVQTALGSGCVTQADLALDLTRTYQGYQAEIRHLDGVDVAAARVDMIIDADQPILINLEDPACRFVWYRPRGNGRWVRCEAGALIAGDVRTFRVTLANSPSSVSSARVEIAGQVVSEAADGDESNNVDALSFRLQ